MSQLNLLKSGRPSILNLSENRTKCRRQTFTLTSIEQDDDALLDVIQHSWHLDNASPLHRLNFDEVYLKNMGKWLREEIAAYLHSGVENTIYKAKFSTKLGLVSDGSKCLQVVVTSNRNEVEKVVYEGIFISGKYNDPRVANQKLPTVIWRSSLKTRNIIHQLLQELFDCKITPLHLSEIDLQWLNAIFCNTIDYVTDGMVTFMFRMDGDDGTVKVGAPTEALHKVWNSIHMNTADDIQLDEVELFYKVVLEQFYKQYSINFSIMYLQQISHPKFRVSSQGFFKITNTTLADAFLRFFQEN